MHNTHPDYAWNRIAGLEYLRTTLILVLVPRHGKVMLQDVIRKKWIDLRGGTGRYQYLDTMLLC